MNLAACYCIIMCAPAIALDSNALVSLIVIYFGIEQWFALVFICVVALQTILSTKLSKLEFLNLLI